jgi:predicted CoA-binding protein
MSIVEEILKNSRTIAVVGLSANPERPSNVVATYLKEKGYKIIPVNPGEKTILGETSYPDLISIPVKIDVVDIFRQSEAEYQRRSQVPGTVLYWARKEGRALYEAAS